MIMLAINKKLDIEQQKRLKKLFFVYLIVAAIMLAYLFIFLFVPFLRIPCMFNFFTGLNCPGCGISRMLASFAQFKLSKGISYNYFLGFTFPYVLFILGYCSYSYVMKKKIKGIEISLIVYMILLLIWGVVRNFIGL